MPRQAVVVDIRKQALVEVAIEEGMWVQIPAARLAEALDKCRTCAGRRMMCERMRKVEEAAVDTVFEGAAVVWSCAAYRREEGEA